MTFVLARSLLLADAITSAALAEALLLSATRRTSLVRALLVTQGIDPVRLEPILERGGAPFMRQIAPVAALVQRLPPGLCERLLAIPVRQDPLTGTVDVAVVDARDPHPVEEVGYWLKAPVRMVRTSIASMESAVSSLAGHFATEPETGMRALAPPIWAPAPTPTPTLGLAQTPAYGSLALDPRGAPGPHTFDRGFEGDGGDQDIAIPLTRRNFSPEPVIELRPETVRRARETDPILYLKRRKAGAPHIEDPLPTSVEPAMSGRIGPPDEPASSAGIDAVVKEMQQARDRDQILDLLVAGVSRVARRVAVLAVRRDALVGWTGSSELADRPALRGVRLVNTMRTVLHEALERDGAQLARMPTDAAHAPLISIMRSPPSGPIGLASVQADGKPIAVVFAADLSDTSVAIERIARMARAAGESLARLLRERRK